MTYTLVKLPVSEAAFDEIVKKLEDAAYHHVFQYEFPDVTSRVASINMEGIALVREEKT